MSKQSPSTDEWQTLKEDLLFALTGDSYGGNLHVDNTAQAILEDILPVFQARFQTKELEGRIDELENLLPKFVHPFPFGAEGYVSSIEAATAIRERLSKLQEAKV